MEAILVFVLVMFGVVAVTIKLTNAGKGGAGSDQPRTRGTTPRTGTVLRTRRSASTATGMTADRITDPRGRSSREDAARAAALAAVASVLTAAAARSATAREDRAGAPTGAAGGVAAPTEEPVPPRTEPVASEHGVGSVYTSSSASYSFYQPTSVYESGASVLEEDGSPDAESRGDS